MGRDLVQKLREEKESQEAQYEEEFREFERMANEKVVQLEEYYVQQLQMKEVHVQQLNEQINTLKEKNVELTTKFTTENNKLTTELNKLEYQSKHDREQLLVLKKRNDGNESKIQAYNA